MSIYIYKFFLHDRQLGRIKDYMNLQNEPEDEVNLHVIKLLFCEMSDCNNLCTRMSFQSDIHHVAELMLTSCTKKI